jgi:hypothetical protein
MILHYASDHILEVGDRLRETPGHPWTTKSFQNTLAGMCNSRRTGEDTSTSIVWKSNKRDLVRWERMCPILVKMLPSSNLPTVKVRIPTELRGLTNIEGLGRDNFFKDIMVQPPQRGEVVALLNQVLMARIMVYIRCHEPKRDKDNFTMSESDMVRIVIDDTKDFSRFFDNKSKRKGQIQQMQKLLRPNPHTGVTSDRAKSILKAAEVNSDCWGKRSVGGELILTTYSDTISIRMHDLLNRDDKTHAVRYAQQGYITTGFLIWLLKGKEKYNHLRKRIEDHSTYVTRALLDIEEDKDG